MFCVDGATERLVHVLCGWCNMRALCMFCVDGANERLEHVLCGWSNRETSVCFLWMVQLRD